MTKYTRSRRSRAIHRLMDKWIKPNTRIHTDEALVYKHAPYQFNVEHVNHRAKEWVRGDAHTNTIEAFWNILKRGIRGTCIAVSPRHLQRCLWEFEYRHNLRKSPHLMLETLLIAFPKG